MARNPKFHQLVDEIKHMHDLKNQDYATDEDPLANLKDCVRLGLHPAMGTVTRMQDKVRRIESFFKRGELVNESVRDSLVDLAIYSLLAVIILDEDTPEPVMPEMSYEYQMPKPADMPDPDKCNWSDAAEEMTSKP